VSVHPPTLDATRNVLRELVSGLTDGIIVIDTDGTISWANASALAMHRIQDIGGLGGTVADYRRQFSLRYRNNHLLDQGQYPLERIAAGESFNSVTVEVSPKGLALGARADYGVRTALRKRTNFCATIKLSIPRFSDPLI
jgi:PAS domain-containing protein